MRPGERHSMSDPGLTAMGSVPHRRTRSGSASVTRQGASQRAVRGADSSASRPRRTLERRSTGGGTTQTRSPELRSSQMAGNRGVAYIEPGKVEVQQTDYPKLELQDGPG